MINVKELSKDAMKTLKEISCMYPEYNWICENEDGTISLFKSDFKPVVWGRWMASSIGGSYWCYCSEHKETELTTNFPIVELKHIKTKWPKGCEVNGLKIVSKQDIANG